MNMWHGPCAHTQKRLHYYANATRAKLYIYIGIGARDLYIDQAQALDIFRFAVSFVTSMISGNHLEMYQFSLKICVLSKFLYVLVPVVTFLIMSFRTSRMLLQNWMKKVLWLAYQGCEWLKEEQSNVQLMIPSRERKSFCGCHSRSVQNFLNMWKGLSSSLVVVFNTLKSNLYQLVYGSKPWWCNVWRKSCPFQSQHIEQ